MFLRRSSFLKSEIPSFSKTNKTLFVWRVSLKISPVYSWRIQNDILYRLVILFEIRCKWKISAYLTLFINISIAFRWGSNGVEKKIANFVSGYFGVHIHFTDWKYYRRVFLSSKTLMCSTFHTMRTDNNYYSVHSVLLFNIIYFELGSRGKRIMSGNVVCIRRAIE